jgi:hypothetical protein
MLRRRYDSAECHACVQFRLKTILTNEGEGKEKRRKGEKEGREETSANGAKVGPRGGSGRRGPTRLEPSFLDHVAVQRIYALIW